MPSVDFGVFLGLERPSYASILDDVLHCEKLGYHSVSYTANMQARYGAAGGDRRPPLAGTHEQVAEQIGRYVDAGVSLFMVRFMGEDFKKEAELFADEVVPQFR